MTPLKITCIKILHFPCYHLTNWSFFIPMLRERGRGGLEGAGVKTKHFFTQKFLLAKEQSKAKAG